MTIQGAGFGVSANESTEDAVGEAVSKAMQALGDDGPKPTIAFVSATVSRDINQVRLSFVEKLPENILIHGITSSGAVLTPDGAVDAGVGCLLIAAEEGDFASAYDSKDGTNAAGALKGKMADPQAIFMGATPGAEEDVVGILTETFPGIPVYGGTAADNELRGEWMVFSGEESSDTGVSVIGVGNSVKFGASMLGPYKPTRKKATATKTEGRRVFEIDGMPAADWVYEWLGKDESIKGAYEGGGLILPQTAQKPIAFIEKKKSYMGILPGKKDYITAHCAAFGGKEKWVDFFAPIPQGATLFVMDSADGPTTGYAAALSNAHDTAKAALDGATPKAGLLVFCGGMAIAVGDKLDAGLTSTDFATKTKMFPMMGMTCFGEQACLPSTKINVQRNLSVGMILFG